VQPGLKEGLMFRTLFFSLLILSAVVPGTVYGASGILYSDIDILSYELLSINSAGENHALFCAAHSKMLTRSCQQSNSNIVNDETACSVVPLFFSRDESFVSTNIEDISSFIKVNKGIITQKTDLSPPLNYIS